MEELGFACNTKPYCTALYYTRRTTNFFRLPKAWVFSFIWNFLVLGLVSWGSRVIIQSRSPECYKTYAKIAMSSSTLGQ